MDTEDKTLGGLLPLPLSTLMRKGAKMAPQCRHGFVRGRELEQPASTCALSAVAHAILGYNATVSEVRDLAWTIMRRLDEFEAPGKLPRRLSGYVVRESDAGTREAVATTLKNWGW